MNTNAKKVIKPTFDAWTYGPVHTKVEKAATKLYLVEDAKSLSDVITDATNIINNVAAKYDEIRAQIKLHQTAIDELKLLLPIETKASTYKKPVNVGVGDFIKNLISQGDGNTVILKKVHEHYGNTNTTYACVAWYRNKVNQS